MTVTFTVSNLNSEANASLSLLSVANIEALATNENHGYANAYEDIVEIHDDKTDTHKKVTIKICEGTGSLNC